MEGDAKLYSDFERLNDEMLEFDAKDHGKTKTGLLPNAAAIKRFLIDESKVAEVK